MGICFCHRSQSFILLKYLSINIAIVGKYIYVFSTSRYLLEQDFPGMRIGPEPTTDSFIAVMYGETEGNVPGNALVVDPKKPFRKLGRFGNAFLNRWDHLVFSRLMITFKFWHVLFWTAWNKYSDISRSGGSSGELSFKKVVLGKVALW